MLERSKFMAAGAVVAMLGTVAQAAILVDLGDASGFTGGYNHFDINASNSGGLNASMELQDFTNDTATPTGITATITGRFNSRTTGGPTSVSGDASKFAGASSTAGYGDNTYSQASFTFTNLDPATAYDFTFFGSRIDGNASDNRSTQYQLVGATTSSTSLQALNNTSNVATLDGIHSDANGTLVLNVSKAVENTNSNGYYYLNAFEIAVPEPSAIGLAGLMALPMLRRRRA